MGAVRRIRLNCLTVAIGSQEEPLGRDLERLKGRARGARLRQLAMLGLAVESEGLRLSADGRLGWIRGESSGAREVMPPSPALPGTAQATGGGGGMNEIHRAAMQDLVASLGGFPD
jgi:hypothetical protein